MNQQDKRLLLGTAQKIQTLELPCPLSDFQETLACLTWIQVDKTIQACTVHLVLLGLAWNRPFQEDTAGTWKHPRYLKHHCTFQEDKDTEWQIWYSWGSSDLQGNLCSLWKQSHSKNLLGTPNTAPYSRMGCNSLQDKAGLCCSPLHSNVQVGTVLHSLLPWEVEEKWLLHCSRIHLHTIQLEIKAQSHCRKTLHHTEGSPQCQYSLLSCYNNQEGMAAGRQCP